MIKKELVEILNAISELDDNALIDENLRSNENFNQFVKDSFSLDTLKSKENDAEFKSYLDSIKDVHTNTALETWKKNNLEKLINAEILKRNPKKTDQDLRLEAMEKQLNEERGRREMAELKAKFKEEFVDIPAKVLQMLVQNDEEITRANLSILKSEIGKSNADKIQAEVEKRLKESNYQPPSDDAQQKKDEDEINRAFGFIE